MKTAIINLKIDPDLKAKAQERARALGVPLSYVLRMHLLNFTRGEKLELPAENTTPHLDKLIEEVEAEIEKGEVSPSFDADDIEGMKRWLNTSDES